MLQIDVVAYIKAALRARARRIVLLWVVLASITLVYVRFTKIEYTASVKVFGSLPTTPMMSMNMPFSSTMNAFDRDLLITSQEAIVYSRPIFEKIKEEISPPSTDAPQPPTSYENLKTKIKTLLFGADYVENSNKWANYEYSQHKSRLNFVPHLDEGHFDINYRSQSPENAIKSASLLADAVIKKNIEISNSKSKSLATFLGKKVEEIENKLKDIDAEVNDYAKKNRFLLADQFLTMKYQNYMENKERLRQTAIELEGKVAALKYNASALSDLKERAIKSINNSSIARIDALTVEIASLESILSQSESEKDRTKISKKIEKLRLQLSEALKASGGLSRPEEIQQLIGNSEVENLKAQAELKSAQHIIQGIKRVDQENSKEIENLPQIQSRFSQLMFQHSQLGKALEGLTQNYMNALIQSEGQIATLFVIEEPQLIVGLSGAGRAKVIVGSFVVAAILAACFFLFLDYFRQIIHLGAQLENVPGATYLGAIKKLTPAAIVAPQISLSLSKVSRGLIKHLRQDKDTSCKIVIFGSNRPWSGKTTTCYLLGNAFARKGHRVLVVDFDNLASSRSLSRLYQKARNSIETIEINFDSESFQSENHMRQRQGKTAQITLCKRSAETSSVLVHPQQYVGKCREFLAKAKNEFDYIFVDAAPIGVETTTEIIDTADAVLLCCPESKANVVDFASSVSLVESYTDRHTKIFSVCTLSQESDSNFENWESYYNTNKRHNAA